MCREDGVYWHSEELLLLRVLVEHTHLLLMLPVELLVHMVSQIEHRRHLRWSLRDGFISVSRCFNVRLLVVRWLDCLLVLLFYLHGKLRKL